MKIDLKKEIPLILIALIPLVYLFLVWNSLPEEIPIHYNFLGEADRFGSKTTLIFISLISLVTYFILLAVPYIDPKKQLNNMGNKYFQIKLTTILMLSALFLFINYKTLHTDTPIQFMIVVLGIFFAALGNYFQTIKPNYFLGIRTPWTLQNETVWVKTHQQSGKIWMVFGLLMAISYFLFPLKVASFLMIVFVIIMAIVPFIMSYLLFQKITKAKN